MDYFSGRYSQRGGFFELASKKIPKDFMKKSIKIENLDEMGNAVGAMELTQEDIECMLVALWAKNGPMIYIQDKFPTLFTEEELVLVNNILLVQDALYIHHEDVLEIRALLDKEPLEKLQYAMNMTSVTGFGRSPFNVHPNNPYYEKQFTFEEALEFIGERPGIYYAIDNEGKHRFDFIDAPTKKQAQYQRNKNGNRIVFYSFKDWKEYLVREDELDK